MTMALWVPVDRSQEKPLIRQVYEQVRMHILYGHLQAGERLPSTRELAADLHVSRIVILEAYDQLLAEGYLEARPGSGTYVAEGAYLEAVPAEQAPPGLQPANAKTAAREIIDFRSGLPALDLFPRKIWGRLAQQVYAESSPFVFGYDNPEGRTELRTVLSRYLLRTRGVRCDPGRLVITSGATQAFTLIARLLLSSGDEIIIEDPVTSEVQAIFSSGGASLYPIAVDAHGMRTALLPGERKPGFVFVTPSHQFPLGGILPIQRRIQLIQFARNSDCYIVEDDYDSEFRYQGAPISSLQGLDPDCVIYVGTFSKVLSPALRLGYMVLPPDLIQRCRSLKRLTDLHTPTLEQLILARFIEQGYLERHIAKMKKIYRKRREVLINALETSFSDQLSLSGDATGLHLITEFHGREFTEQTLQAAERAGVRIYPVEQHAIRKGYHRNKVVLGYGNLSQEQIVEGIKRMKTALR